MFCNVMLAVKLITGSFSVDLESVEIYIFVRIYIVAYLIKNFRYCF